jgi:hypothetical protein
MQTRIYTVQTPEGFTVYILPDLDFSQIVRPK